MCIINDKAHVSNTRIFVSPDKTYKKQLTMYENKVQTQIVNNAMILPVPSLFQGADVQLHDMSEYPKVMDDVNSVFETPFTLSHYSNSNSSSSSSLLDVVECGSYLVSVVPTIDDFHRINAEVFVIDSNVQDILRKYYWKQYSFLVCLLKPGPEHTYHPIAYSHPLVSGKLFVPTRHHHGFSTNEEITSFFDHEIFSVCASAHPSEKWLGTIPSVISEQQVSDFEFPSLVNVMTKSILKGEYANSDFWFTVLDMPDTTDDGSCVVS